MCRPKNRRPPPSTVPSKHDGPGTNEQAEMRDGSDRGGQRTSRRCTPVIEVVTTGPEIKLSAESASSPPVAPPVAYSEPILETELCETIDGHSLVERKRQSNWATRFETVRCTKSESPIASIDAHRPKRRHYERLFRDIIPRCQNKLLIYEEMGRNHFCRYAHSQKQFVSISRSC